MSVSTIIRDPAAPGQPLEGIVLDPEVLDAPDLDGCAEVVEERFCLACQVPVARFESLGGDLAHYVGDPMNDYVTPFETDHAPYLP